MEETVSLWQGQITLDTYGWEQALVPTEQDDPIYPYPRMDMGQVGPPSARPYQTIVLENAYVRVTMLPDLGGRIVRWEDKGSGRLLTYANKVIKPVDGWGYRGWWFATGGLEWAFPTDEHGLNEYRPWAYELLSGPGWRGVRVWDTDDHTGLQVQVTVKLFAGRSDLSITPRITNPTGAAQPFQFWINAMLTLSGGYAPTSGLHFWVPTGEMIVHSTNDTSLPAPGATITWPAYGDRDWSHYAEWRDYLGVFAATAAGAAGAYDEAVDTGIVRAYPRDVARGVKIFCLGDIPSAVYTDDGGRYFEFWGGYTRTFWDYASLPAGGTVTWEERWYPIHGMGGLTWANGDMAAALRLTPEGIEVGLHAPAPTAVRLVLRKDGSEVASWEVTTSPGQPFHTVHSGSDSGWELEIWQGDTLVARVGL